MSAISAIGLEAPAQRYEALLRAANAIASCGDCDTAADVLVEELREVIAFDYLRIVAFDSGTGAVGWHLLYSNGRRRNVSPADVLLEATPIEWVHEYHRPLVIPDWGHEMRFPKHAGLLNELGIATTCTISLARDEIKEKKVGKVKLKKRKLEIIKRE